MAVKVVDASAIGALLFGEPSAETVTSQLSDARSAAPALLPFEVANICWKKVRRHPELRAPLLAAHEMLPRMAIDIVAVQHQEVLRLALATGLTGYDASYLWLARHLSAELVTLDAKLANAFRLSS
jgi:predicted nucleic acid-binding protein